MRSSKRQVHCVNKKYSSKCIGKFTTYVAGCSISSSTPRWRKTTKSFCKEWASKLAESDAGSYYNQEKWLKDDKASEKPIETTAKSSFTSLLASGASFLGRKAARRATNSQQVPRHIKIGLFWKSIVAGEKLQEKLQEAVCCQFFQESVELLENVLSKSWIGSTWLVCYTAVFSGRERCVTTLKNGCVADYNLACPVRKWKLPVANK